MFPPNQSLPAHLTETHMSCPPSSYWAHFLYMFTLCQPHSPPCFSQIHVSYWHSACRINQLSIYQKGMLKLSTIKVKSSTSYFNSIRFYLNITINQVDLINTYRTLYLTTVKYTLFSDHKNIHHYRPHSGS